MIAFFCHYQTNIHSSKFKAVTMTCIIISSVQLANYRQNKNVAKFPVMCVPTLLSQEIRKKKCSFNLGIFQTRSNPPTPPWIFWTFGALFCRLIFLVECFGHFLCHNSPKIWEKEPKIVWIWSTPSFSTQNSTFVGAQQ